MNTYTATVTREGDAWLAECDDVPTAHTWATTLTALRREIADAIILAADLPDDAQVTVLLAAGDGVAPEVARAIDIGNRRTDLRAAENELRAATLAAVRDLGAAGWPVRDVAGALGLTPGRVSQIA